ncbi:hypothetical protein AKN93_09705 [Thiopseudomonas alkaliphila]|uniref:Na+/H+ antiporter subunit E n=1 Tax=Thiopseudomonas alkaliphila TaxID=1697053 RepID=UPI00069E2867|nr:Na+/H+ antiporter subunit E [Thiopseudomonas alkaliphila]AKX46531.1 hypothetical protein AKN94_03550 [Thiopseudomonas alkaliphila]AKX49632.1 hypothetical protein AKN93_09705 [Thiopseudomonas alkaliphila]
MSHKRRWFAHPLATLGLTLVWLLLVNDFTSVGHWLFGAFLGLLIPWLTDGWWPNLVRIQSWSQLCVFAMHMLVDIIKANFDVAKLILGSMKELDPSFVELPYDVENELAIFMLASAISLAPGTVAASVDRRRKIMLVHALHCTDDQALIEEIKQRYEAPLMQVFPCSVK